MAEQTQEKTIPMTPYMTPYAAVYREVLDLCQDIHKWEDKTDPHGVLPWLIQRRAALEEAMRLLDEYDKVRKALALLKTVI
jgi:hypothetical protein